MSTPPDQPNPNPKSNFSLLLEALTELFPKLLAVIGSISVCIYCIQIGYFPSEVKIGDGLFLVFLAFSLGLFYIFMVFIPSFFLIILIHYILNNLSYIKEDFQSNLSYITENFQRNYKKIIFRLLIALALLLTVASLLLKEYTTTTKTLLLLSILLGTMVFLCTKKIAESYIPETNKKERIATRIGTAALVVTAILYITLDIILSCKAFSTNLALPLILAITLNISIPYALYSFLEASGISHPETEKKNYIKIIIFTTLILNIALLFPQLSEDIFSVINIRKTGVTVQIPDDKEFNRIKKLSESSRCNNFTLDSDKKLIHNVDILWHGVGANTWISLPAQSKHNTVLSIESKHIALIENIPFFKNQEGSCWDLTEDLSPIFQQPIKGNKTEVKQKLFNKNNEKGMEKIFEKQKSQLEKYFKEKSSEILGGSKPFYNFSQPQVKLIDKENNLYRYTHDFWVDIIDKEKRTHKNKITIQFDFSTKNIHITNKNNENKKPNRKKHNAKKFKHDSRSVAYCRSVPHSK